MPVLALLVISMIAVIFVFVGQVNTLGPVVTMPFMLTYGAVDYSNFVLAMSCRKVPFGGPLDRDFVDEAGAERLSPHLPSTLSSSNSEYGAVESSKCDRASDEVLRRGHWSEKTGVKPQNEKSLDKNTVAEITSLASEIDDSTSLLGSGKMLHVWVLLISSISCYCSMVVVVVFMIVVFITVHVAVKVKNNWF